MNITTLDINIIPSLEKEVN